MCPHNAVEKINAFIDDDISYDQLLDWFESIDTDKISVKKSAFASAYQNIIDGCYQQAIDDIELGT